jgi:ribonuclease P protein component
MKPPTTHARILRRELRAGPVDPFDTPRERCYRSTPFGAGAVFAAVPTAPRSASRAVAEVHAKVRRAQRPRPREGARREAHLSAAQLPPQTYARIPGADGYSQWSTRPGRSAKAGPQAPHGEHRPQMKPQGLPRRLRLRRRGEFLRVQRSGEKHHTRHFLVFVAPIPPSPDAEPRRVAASCGGPVMNDLGDRRLPPTRLGVTVTRKVGGAVVRNRIKRYVREAFRRNRESFPPGLDMVWVAKRVAAGVDSVTVATEVGTVAGRLRRRGAPSSVREAQR